MQARGKLPQGMPSECPVCLYSPLGIGCFSDSWNPSGEESGLSHGGTPASLLFRITRGRPGRRCSTGGSGLLSVMAESAFATSCARIVPVSKTCKLVSFCSCLSCPLTVIYLYLMRALIGYGPSLVEVSHACTCRSHLCKSPYSI